MQTENGTTDAAKHISLEEFRANMVYHLFRRERLVIEHEGQPLGYFTPATRTSPEETQAILRRLAESVQRALTETGMTEDELVDALDLTKPLSDAARR